MPSKKLSISDGHHTIACNLQENPDIFLRIGMDDMWQKIVAMNDRVD
jgi:hypothetical protein